ncbi:MAG: chloride channel protein, partial [Bacteroidaceae bacterium]|nr:chloride channel protein [Bacteroidaceae bacterium]
MSTYEKHQKTWFGYLLKWREKHISEKKLILLLALVVGWATATAALVMKTLIHVIEQLLTNHFDRLGFNWLYLLYPVLGIFLTGLFVRHIVRDDI